MRWTVKKNSLDIDIPLLTTQTSRNMSEARSDLIKLLPGINRRLMIWEGVSHYFDRTVVALAPPRHGDAGITAAYPFGISKSGPSAPFPLA